MARLTRAEREALVDALNSALAGEEIDGHDPDEQDAVRATMESARAKLRIQLGWA